ncbi:MAG TPA: helix-turn-helix transcriptional regulator [Acidimicrobiia bacterium]|nr:helix-turn-helix transcriptional regulator [Acidimicrobiia bacterium]
MSVSFGDSIRRGRETVGLSQARVAQLIGRSPSTVRAWEQGRSQPSDSDSVAALAAVLGLDENGLLRKAGFEPAAQGSRASLESELASLRTVDVPVARESTRHLEWEGAVATAPPPDEPWIEVEKPAFDIRTWIEPRAKAVVARANDLITDFQQRLKDRPKPEPRPRPAPKASKSPDLVASQPAPPPVRLDPRLGPLVAKSYIEDDAERDFYRRRMVGTLLVLVFLFITLWWALRNTGGAIGDFVGGFIDELKIQ